MLIEYTQSIRIYPMLVALVGGLCGTNAQKTELEQLYPVRCMERAVFSCSMVSSLKKLLV